MAIFVNQTEQIYTIETKNTTYQMKVNEKGVLLHTYYGRRIGAEDLSYAIADNMLHAWGTSEFVQGDEFYARVDNLPQEISCFGNGDYRESALAVRQADGSLGLQPIFESARVEKGKYSIPGLPAFYGEEGETLIVTLKDRVYDIYVHLYYGVLPEYDLITRSLRVENKTDKSIHLERALSLTLDFEYGNYDMISFYGSWAKERTYQRTPIVHMTSAVQSARGASGHLTSPAAIFCTPDTTEDHGEAWGLSFVYSGNFLISAAKSGMKKNTRVVAGINPQNFNYEVAPGDTFCTPEVAMVYSGEGLGAMSRNFHRAVRNNLCRGEYKNARRPILINNWEGTYFDFTADKLVSMAEEAAKLGVELFVMDDGWFGKRDSDNSGLGDWFPNEEKLGCSLRELSERINRAGLKFGIWFEPECVSEDSDLFRAHPDYAFRQPGRVPTLYRHQLILDYSRKEVRDNIYNQLKAVLDSANISYVKWDFNRNITDMFSTALPAEKQGEVFHRYMLGLYELLERITTEYPHVLFESCSGGGGRFDCGMHHYMPQAWTSDDTDPIERLKIQYGTSFVFPVSTMGAHVSAVPNHQTGRITPLKTRGIVAYFGTYGLELDTNKLTDEEKTEITRQIAEFKQHYELIQRGEYYRLISPYDTESLYCVWEVAKEDGSEALVAAVRQHNMAFSTAEVVKLRGLAPEKHYSVNGSERTVSGAALMSCGLPLNNYNGDYHGDLYHIVAVD